MFKAIGSLFRVANNVAVGTEILSEVYVDFARVGKEYATGYAQELSHKNKQAEEARQLLRSQGVIEAAPTQAPALPKP